MNQVDKDKIRWLNADIDNHIKKAKANYNRTSNKSYRDYYGGELEAWKQLKQLIKEYEFI